KASSDDDRPAYKRAAVGVIERRDAIAQERVFCGHLKPQRVFETGERARSLIRGRGSVVGRAHAFAMEARGGSACVAYREATLQRYDITYTLVCQVACRRLARTKIHRSSGVIGTRNICEGCSAACRLLVGFL